jgi:hypothetical protein
VTDGNDAGRPLGQHHRAVARAAIKRLKAQNDFKKHLAAYLAVNTMLTMIWAFTNAGHRGRGASASRHSHRRMGIGLVIHGYVTHRGNVYTAEKIQREMTTLP